MLPQQNTHGPVSLVQLTESFFFFFFPPPEYFSQHLGEYENVLAALEDLNMSILKAMDKTKKVSGCSKNHAAAISGRGFGTAVRGGASVKAMKLPTPFIVLMNRSGKQRC